MPLQQPGAARNGQRCFEKLASARPPAAERQVVRKAKGRSQAGDDQRPDSWVPVGGVSEVEVMAPSFSRTSSIAFTSSLLPGGPATVLACDRFRRSAGGCLCAVTSSTRRRFGCSCGKLLACEVLVAVSNSALHAPGAGGGQW